ncbi:MAG: DinB family protein, partial [Gammaproteobacteria bacterium]
MNRQTKHNSAVPLASQSADKLTADYLRVRQDTEDLCKGLEVEDYQIQTMPDVSPLKWHIAHVSWFFETFLLQPFLKNYQVFHPKFAHLFNSYY